MRIINTGLIAILVNLAAAGCASNDSDPAFEAATFDGLVPVADSRVDSAFIDPEADFSVYQRVALQSPSVAFRRNWQRDQNRTRAHRVSDSDMQRIKEDVASLFDQVFTERLEAAGYTVVEGTGADILLLSPAIIDLDIAAPDVMEAGRIRSFTTDTGRATLYMQLFDSATGEILGRATDRRIIRNNSGSGQLSWSNSVTNRADARRAFIRWADRLVEFLDKHYK